MRILKHGLVSGCLALACSLMLGCGSGAAESGAEAYAVVASSSSSSGSSTTGTVSPQTSAPPATAQAKVTVQGAVTYDRVPFGTRSFSGLDYASTQALPVRGVTVQALAQDGSVVGFSATDEFGQFQIAVAENAEIKIRVLAELLGQTNAAWDVQVKDNTQGNALYVLDGSYAPVGTQPVQTRNLHAASGWDGQAYTAPRAAGPFAILDSVYDAITTVVDADPSVVLPPLSIYWSVNNIAISGDASAGAIGTSYYSSYGPSIYLLGAANNDSDEYDRAVIQHEFGHYLEHQLARTESIGGSHSVYSKLDMRVAFGEAWGNAFAAMASGDAVYRDSLGAAQSLGFSIDVERKTGDNGWFSEASIQAILYDLVDGENDDNLSFGFASVYRTLLSNTYLDFAGFSSIYAFISAFKQQHPTDAAEIDTLVQSFNIYGSGWWGEGETNDAGSAVTLPVYHRLYAGQQLNLCSDSDYQKYNGVDVRRYVRVHVDSAAEYTFEATRSHGGLSATNPQLRLYSKGMIIASATGSTLNRETLRRQLPVGEYVVELYEQANAQLTTSTGGLACFNLAMN